MQLTKANRSIERVKPNCKRHNVIQIVFFIDEMDLYK